MSTVSDFFQEIFALKEENKTLKEFIETKKPLLNYAGGANYRRYCFFDRDEEFEKLMKELDQVRGELYELKRKA